MEDSKCQIEFHDHFVLLINPSVTETCKAFDDVYTVGHIIGEGVYGIVRTGFNKITNKKVALKILKFESDNEIANFKNEIANLKQLLKVCDMFICIEGWGMRRGKIFIAMEYINGISLRDYIVKKERSESESESGFESESELETQNVEIFFSWSKILIRELELLHKTGIAHTDIHDNNIMIDFDRGILKIIDFGLGCSENISCHISPSKYTPDHFENTFNGAQKVDWYALSVVLLDFATCYHVNYEDFRLSPLLYIQNSDINNDIKNIITGVYTRSIK